MISGKISELIAQALKTGQPVRLSTLRLLSSAFNYEKIALQHELSETDEVNVIRREAKERKEAIEAYEKAGATDRAEKEKEELQILSEFLPPEMPEEDVQRIIDEVISSTGAKTMADMGKVIAEVKQKTANAVDGGKIAMLVKAKLS